VDLKRKGIAAEQFRGLADAVSGVVARVRVHCGRAAARAVSLGSGERSLIVFWALLVVLAVIAVALVILSRARGGDDV
jgi:hypothetical protein